MSIKFNDYQLEVKARRKAYLGSVARVLDSGWYILGSEVDGFERKFAEYLGVKYCVGVANGLEAIQIGLMALGIGAGDEVITTPVSAVATTLAIVAVGATPVFVDVNEMGQIDASKIAKKITDKTKAILPVHLYGQPCEIDKILEIAREHNLFLVEDAAQAHGSTYKGKKLGGYGDVGCFSFYPTKNVGAFGDGGAIVTDNKDLAESFRQIRDYGQASKYVHVRYGLNSRLDELHAALLKVKLSYLDKDNQVRRKLAERYIENLSGVDGLQLVLPERVDDSNFHLFVIRTKNRNALQKYLEKNGIPSLIHYPITIPDQPMFGDKYKNLDIPVARKFVKEILSIPCHPFLKFKDVDYITSAIKALD